MQVTWHALNLQEGKVLLRLAYHVGRSCLRTAYRHRLAREVRTAVGDIVTGGKVIGTNLRQTGDVDNALTSQVATPFGAAPPKTLGVGDGLQVTWHALNV